MKLPPRPGVVLALCALLAVEFLLVAGYAVFLVVELLVATPDSLGSAVALTALAVVCAVWLGAILVGMWRGRAWSRGGGVVWQILQFAVGVGALQGAFAQPVWGWPLTAAAIAGVLLLLSAPVTRWLRPEGEG